jgi:metal-responsive CopG/Arc/MetJ family transcriptional regulator
MNAAKKPGGRKPKVPAIAARARKKVVVDFPEPLFRETENAAAELSTSRSSFIRLAVEEYIRERRQKKLQDQLIDGYTANANAARETAEELAQFD